LPHAGQRLVRARRQRWTKENARAAGAATGGARLLKRPLTLKHELAGAVYWGPRIEMDSDQHNT